MSTKNIINFVFSNDANDFQNELINTIQEKVYNSLHYKRVEIAKDILGENARQYVPFYGNKDKEKKAKEFVDNYNKKREEYRQKMKERKSQNEEVEIIDEVLSASSGIKTWIDDFIKSNAPQFEGKSKEQRRKMAIAAYYAKQRS